MRGVFFVELLDVKGVDGRPIRVCFDSLKVCRQVQELLTDLGFVSRFGKEFV